MQRIHIAAIAFSLLLCTLSILQCSQNASSYLNTDPEVQYTGTKSCQSCHQKIYDSYLETGMGKSFYPPEPKLAIEEFEPHTVVHDSFSGYSYHPFWKGQEMFLLEFKLKGKDTLYQRTEQIDYIVGSGHQTRSYILNRNNYLYEVPITWYVNKQIWDLSPGYHDGNNSRFSREIGEECMACHTGNFEYVEGSKNRFRQVEMGIGCEQCHGPGEEHIRRMEKDQIVDVGMEIDYSIVNPAKLPFDQQFDVCQQCHLQGVNVLQNAESVRDFRPSGELSSVFHVFLEKQAHANAFGIASHAERFKQSQCFMVSNQQKEGSLTCTTCHDPHKSISQTDSMIYIRQCESCHQENVVCTADEAEMQQMSGNCISCHMPSGETSDIPHVNFHDHKIRVVQADEEIIESSKAFLKLLNGMGETASEDSWGKACLQYYEQHSPDPAYLKAADEKLAETSLYERARVAYHQKNYQKAQKILTDLIDEEGENSYYLFLKGELLEAQGQHQAAFEVYDRAFQLNREATEAGIKAAVILLKANDVRALQEAEKRFLKLLKERPFDHRIHTNLAFVYLNQRKPNAAWQHISYALSIEPEDENVLENAVLVSLMQGNAQAARNYWLQMKEVYGETKRVKALEARL